MAERPVLVIQQLFADLPDPRVERTKRHQLLDLITIAVCAVVSGADTWVDVEQWGHAKADWLAAFLDLPNGIPSHDTFGRVFARLDPAAFERCSLTWIQTVLPAPAGEVVAVDGRVLRRSHDRGGGRAAIDLVSAWAEERRLVLGQQAVAADSNEITAVPALLDLLVLDGAIVTVDALHCQTATAEAIRTRGADYVLALKTNQPQTYDAVETFFAEAVRDDWQGAAHQHHLTEDTGHGRLETRQHWTTTDAQLLTYLGRDTAHWPDLGCVGMVERVRVSETGTSRETSYYLSSLDGTVETFARAVRSHWGIENREHWVLDMAFREDESRVRTGDGAENVGVLRRIALNLIRLDRSRKGSVHTKRLKAGWDQTYLLHLLSLSPDD
jgi:predicted transposase YbfD/YdcC